MRADGPSMRRESQDRPRGARPNITKEDIMKLITASALAHKTEAELSALFTAVSRTLARTEAATPDRRNALASLETISRARALRM